MITQTRHTFPLQHDSEGGLQELIRLAEFLNEACPNHSVHWESCKSHFGHLVFESERVDE